jgi:osmotically-inducible protein OsmY
MIAMAFTEEIRCETSRTAQQRLSALPYVELRAVSCHCDSQGILVLRGRLRNYYQKQIAQEAVLGLEGVSLVVNQIEVCDQR